MNQHYVILPVLFGICLASCSSKTSPDVVSDGRTVDFNQALWDNCKNSNAISAFRIEYENNLNNQAGSADDVKDVFRDNCYVIDGSIWCKNDSAAHDIMESLAQDVRHTLAMCCYHANGNFFKTAPIEKYYNTVERQIPTKRVEIEMPNETGLDDNQPGKPSKKSPNNAQEEPGFFERWFGIKLRTETPKERSGTESARESNINNKLLHEKNQDKPGTLDRIFNSASEDNSSYEVIEETVLRDKRASESDIKVTLYPSTFNPDDFGQCQAK